MSGGRDEGVTTRFLRFDPGSGRDAVVTHDFWEEIYIVSGTFESGGRAYPAGCVAVRPPGTPHGPFHSTSGCLISRFATGHPDEGTGVEVVRADRVGPQNKIYELDDGSAWLNKGVIEYDPDHWCERANGPCSPGNAS